jgi:hypothetical protein
MPAAAQPITFIPPQAAMIATDKPRNLMQAGVGGGKTFTAGDILGLFASNIPRALGLVAANTYGQLSDSTVVGVAKVLRDRFGYEENKHYVIDKAPKYYFKPHPYTFKNNYNKIFWCNGAVSMLASLDNYKALDGREVGFAILDETKDTKEQAVKDTIITRLRQKTVRLLKPSSTYSAFRFCATDHPEAGEDINPLFIFTSPAKEQWLTNYFKLLDCEDDFNRVKGSDTEYFQHKTRTRNVIIYSTLLNRENLPNGYIDNLIEDLSADLVDMHVHGSPYAKSGGEYYKSFDKKINIKPVSVTHGYPLLLTFDFNVNPYMPALVAQLIPKKGGRYALNIFKEYALKHPRNTIEDVCGQFVEDFEDFLDYGLKYYGDASGANNIPVKAYRNYFKVVEAELYNYISQDSKCLLKQNPRHKTVFRGSLGRRDFMNKALRGGYDVDINIDPGCKHLIADMQYIKEDKNGAKRKDKVTENGVSFEKYGHHSDALDGLVCYEFGHYAKKQ